MMSVVDRGRMARWAVGLGVMLLLLALWRLFLVLCPTRHLSVLRWALEPQAVQSWSRPEIAALVAENGVENGGPVGEWVGRHFYGKSLVPAQDAPMAAGPQPYDQVHLGESWLRTESISWESQPFKGRMVLVKVFVQARLPQRVPYGRGCFTTEPVTSLVERDYVTVPTSRGWRVAYVYIVYAGSALEQVAALGPGTAAGVLAGC